MKFDKSIGIFQYAQWQLTPQSVVGSGQISNSSKILWLVARVTCKTEEDHMTIEGTRVLAPLYIDFSDGQGQLTPQSVVVSFRNLN